jgi:regulator of sigma E protease
MVTSFVAAAIVLGVLILFHELGHFTVAKRTGVGVLKFSIGFGPKIVGWRVGQTEYVLSAIPLGGFVKMVGEDPDEEVSPAERRFAFHLQPLWKRMAIVLAGPLANLVFAFLAFSIGFAVYGARLPSDAAKVGGVIESMPAAQAGLKGGEQIIAVDGKPIDKWDSLSEIIRSSGGRTLKLTVVRDGATFDLQITPQAEPDKNIFGETVGTAYVIGIQRGFDEEEVGVLTAIGMGARQTAWWIETLVVSIGKMFQGKIPAKDIGGPILIVQEAGKQARLGLEYLLNFMAVISINLGVLNLLPVPVLDGGHFLFFALEAVLRRPLSIRNREIAQQVGLVLLISLMVFAFYNDIVRVLQGWG